MLIGKFVGKSFNPIFEQLTATNGVNPVSGCCITYVTLQEHLFEGHSFWADYKRIASIKKKFVYAELF